MADRFSSDKRSEIMARIGGKNTGPERSVRSILFRAGFRFRLHDPSLPGTPDIVLPKYRTVIFVHGCFWHGHRCSRGKRPLANSEFWNAKLDRNVARDKTNAAQLSSLGWAVETIWTCRLIDDAERVVRNLHDRTRG